MKFASHPVLSELAAPASFPHSWGLHLRTGVAQLIKECTSPFPLCPPVSVWCPNTMQSAVADSIPDDAA